MEQTFTEKLQTTDLVAPENKKDSKRDRGRIREYMEVCMLKIKVVKCLILFSLKGRINAPSQWIWIDLTAIIRYARSDAM